MSVYADFSYVYIYPKFPDSILIQWELVNAFQSGVYKFSVYRSDSPNDEFEKITSVPVIDRYFYEDKIQDMQNSFFVNKYYQVILEMPDGREVASQIVSTGKLADKDTFLKVREIQRKYNLLATTYNGVPVHVLKLRKYGTFCPDCWDEVKKESKDSQCSVCYGTGIVGGYFRPVLVYGHFEMTDQEQKLTLERGMTETSGTSFRCAVNPVINPYDIIVEKDSNRRWIIDGNTKNTELKRIPVSQVLPVKEVPRTHKVYDFNVSD